MKAILNLTVNSEQLDKLTYRNHLFGVMSAAHTNTAAILGWTLIHLLHDDKLRY